MTENEAKDCIKQLKHYNREDELTTPLNNSVSMLWDGAFGIVLDLFEEIQQYREIGTVEECRTAVERMKPKKVKKRHIREFDGYDDGECPNCGNSVLQDGFSYDVFCDDCGQKLDWSE